MRILCILSAAAIVIFPGSPLAAADVSVYRCPDGAGGIVFRYSPCDTPMAGETAVPETGEPAHDPTPASVATLTDTPRPAAGVVPQVSGPVYPLPAADESGPASPPSSPNQPGPAGIWSVLANFLK